MNLEILRSHQALIGAPGAARECAVVAVVNSCGIERKMR